MYGGATHFAEFPFARTPLPRKSSQSFETWLPPREKVVPQDTFLTARPKFVHLEQVTPKAHTASVANDSANPESAIPEPLSQITITANARSILLAIKYGEGLKSREQTVRLTLLTARLRKLAPSVTAAHWEALELATEQIEKVDGRLAQIKARLAEL